VLQSSLRKHKRYDPIFNSNSSLKSNGDMTTPTYVARLKESGADKCDSLRSSSRPRISKESSENERLSANVTFDNDKMPLVKSSVVPTPAHDKEKVLGEGLFGLGPM